MAWIDNREVRAVPCDSAKVRLKPFWVRFDLGSMPTDGIELAHALGVGHGPGELGQGLHVAAGGDEARGPAMVRRGRKPEGGHVLLEYAVETARVDVLRMRVDREPWQDNRVRTALKLCQHREKIMLLAGMKQGTRYKIRKSARRGVTVRPGGEADLPAFYALMEATSARNESAASREAGPGPGPSPTRSRRPATGPVNSRPPGSARTRPARTPRARSSARG